MHRLLFFILPVLVYSSATAEVFKCIEKHGKTSYQSKPCQTAVKELQLNIQSDPEKEAEAKAKLQAIQAEYEAEKAAKQESEKQEAAERNEEASLDIARRSAIAQQEQAEAQKRQAEALEKQNQVNDRPVYVIPPPPPPIVREPREPGKPIPLPKRHEQD